MEYTHKKRIGSLRIIYLALIVGGFILYPLGEGTIKLFFSIASVICLVGGVYFLLKCEMNTITCIIRERKTDFDFFINRSIGRRGNYVCYYYVSDAVKIVKHTKENVSEISKEYKSVGYYSFCHGIFSKDQYIILFKLKDNYDMIVVEMNDEFKAYFEDCMSKAIPVPSDNNEDDESDDENGNEVIENSGEVVEEANENTM